MRYCKVNMMVFYFFDLLLLLLKILFNSVALKLQKQLSNLNASKLLHRAIPIWYYMGCQYVQILFGINWWFFFPNVSFIIDVVISKIEIDLFTFTLYLSFSLFLIFSNGTIEILFLSNCQLYLYPFLIVRLIVVFLD